MWPPAQVAPCASPGLAHGQPVTGPTPAWVAVVVAAVTAAPRQGQGQGGAASLPPLVGQTGVPAVEGGTMGVACGGVG